MGAGTDWMRLAGNLQSGEAMKAVKAVCFCVASASLVVLVFGQFVSVHASIRSPFEMVMLTALIVFVLSLIGWMLLKGRK